LILVAALAQGGPIARGAEPTPATPASAADGPAAPPVDELIARVLERAPTVAALRARLQAARERVRPAGAFPDPMLEAGVQWMGAPRIGANSVASLEFRQELPFPGKRKARREAAEADAAVSGREFDALRRRVVAQTRTLYARLYAIDRERRTLRDAGDLLTLLSATVGARYGTGQADAEALIKTQLELSAVREREDDLQAERAEIASGLDRLLDQPDAPLGEVRELPAVGPPPASLEGSAAERSAEVAIAEAAVRAAESRLREARLDRLPDFAVGVGGGVDGMAEPVVMGKFGVTLPLWQRTKYQPLIRAAEQELEAARQDLRDVKAGARADAARLSAAWRAADRQVARYQDAIGPQSQAALDAARAAYLSGRGDFATVVDDFRRRLESRTQAARREADRFMAWAEAEALITPSPDAPEKGAEE
jgi:outer membrane protein TolC